MTFVVLFALKMCHRSVLLDNLRIGFYENDKICSNNNGNHLASHSIIFDEDLDIVLTYQNLRCFWAGYIQSFSCSHALQLIDQVPLVSFLPEMIC